MEGKPKILVFSTRKNAVLDEAISRPGVIFINPKDIGIYMTEEGGAMVKDGEIMDISTIKYAYFPGTSPIAVHNLMFFLESMGVTCIPSPDAYLNACSKAKTYLLMMKDGGIPIIPTILGTGGAYNVLGSQTLVSKPDKGSLGQNVKLIKSSDVHVSNGVDAMPSHKSLLQKYVTPSNGQRCDLRLVVYDDKVLCAEKRFSDKDFRTNLSLGNHGEAYTPTEEERKLAIEAVKRIEGLHVGGVDLIYDGDTLRLLEINPFPGDKICNLTGTNFYKYIIDDLMEK